MTPLETKATDALVAVANDESQINWSRTNASTDEWIGQWRGVNVRVNAAAVTPELYVGRWLVSGFDATPIVVKIINREDKAYKGLLRSLAGGVE